MPKHELRMQVVHPIPISNTDVEVVVSTDGKRAGRLKISKGGLDWLPSPNSTNSWSLTWEKFAETVEATGRAKRQVKRRANAEAE